MSSAINYIAIVLGITAIAFTLWKEWKRQSRKNLAWRILASVFAILALIELIIPIQVDKEPGNGNGKQAIILTEGYRDDSIRKFTGDLSSGPTYIDASKFVGLADSGFEMIHVFGYGLSREELIPLAGLPIRFHGEPAPTALQSASWQKKITLGKPLRVQGQYRNEESNAVNLLLTGMNNRFDSALIPANSNVDFSLSALPRQLGRAQFRLVALDKDTVANEPLPFETVAARTLNVFILASTPGFENKFLSQWLSKQGYGVAMKTLISKQKFDHSFLNLKTVPLGTLTSGFLNSMDLMIADPFALSGLSTSEQSVVRKQIEEGGMGLVVHADSLNSTNGWYLSPFKLTPSIHLNSGNLQVRIAEHNGKAYTITAEQAVFLRPEMGTQAWVKDSANRIIVGSSLSGQGKKVLITLSRTYPWVLSGNEEAYAGFWSQLVEKASRPLKTAGTWKIVPAFPGVDEETQITRDAGNESEKPLQVNDIHLAMAQDPLLPFRSTGKTWPIKAGWQAAIPEQNELQWWFVYKNNEWLSVKRNIRLNETREFILNNHAIPTVTTSTNAKTPLSGFFPFLVFIFCCGFLWIESKLYGERN